MARLQELYNNELREQLRQKLGLRNPMQVPRITKITLNMGVGEAVADRKVLDSAMSDMERISGQKPVKTVARKSVAGFKIREGYPIGCKVTLRRERMYELGLEAFTAWLAEVAPWAPGAAAVPLAAPVRAGAA